MEQLAALKKEVIDNCRKALEQRIAETSGSIRQLRDSAAEETKSSAGDKYETAREMIQQELDKHEMQLADARRQIAVLDGINMKENPVVVLGSLIETDHGFFFLSVSSGALVAGGRTIVPVSAQSPLGARLIGKQRGDTVIINQRTYKILSVY